MRGYITPKNCSYHEGSWHNYSRDLGRQIRTWNRSLGWAPKDLRNCLPTFAVTQGIHGEVWEQYIGHAPKSITARHYVPRLASASSGEKEALNHQMAVFQLQVIKPLDEAMNQLNRGKILNFFERDANDGSWTSSPAHTQVQSFQ